MSNIKITTNSNDLNILKIFKPATYKKEDSSYYLSFQSNDFFEMKIKNDKLLINDKELNPNLICKIQIDLPNVYLFNVYLNPYFTTVVYDFFYKLWRFEIKNPSNDFLKLINVEMENLNLLEFYIRFNRLECITTKRVYNDNEFKILNN